ncbi:carboxymuconolactone decarboxylase family protein [candidate division KSB1 bacterium]|nr:MAG: carboxymuconolactone decarboxylase family protein [candidate division KSB1 bacterium]
MGEDLRKFKEYREKMNEKILGAGNLDLKRFFALDSSVYRKGALDSRTKELLGLVASTVLRCNDCILYHLIKCREQGVKDQEIHEALSIALIVGGSITIPHLRYAFQMLEEINEESLKNKK